MFSLAPTTNIASSTYQYSPVIEQFYSDFKILEKEKKWSEIVSAGKVALEEAKSKDNFHDEARICAIVTSSLFYLGQFNEGFDYANRCKDVSLKIKEWPLYVRGLYLLSAVYRGLKSFDLAVQTAEEALQVYIDKKIENDELLNKVHLNYGAAYADNPKATKNELEKAASHYCKAIDCLTRCEDNEQNLVDLIRLKLRLGKVYLLQENFQATAEIIKEVRQLELDKRLEIHTDYLEAQLKFELKEFNSSKEITMRALDNAKKLDAKEDIKRLEEFLKKIQLYI